MIAFVARVYYLNNEPGKMVRIRDKLSDTPSGYFFSTKTCNIY